MHNKSTALNINFPHIWIEVPISTNNLFNPTKKQNYFRWLKLLRQELNAMIPVSIVGILKDAKRKEVSNNIYANYHMENEQTRL